jgi:DNA-binding IclR family transcriptional regulator
MIKVLEKSFSALEAIAARGPSHLRDLSAETGIGKTTLLTILKTMVSLGYLEQDGGDRYGFSARLRALPRSQNTAERLTALGHAAVEALVKEVGESAVLITYAGGKRHTLAKHEGGRFVTVNPDAWEGPFLSFASGRLLFALLPDGERRAILRREGAVAAYWPEARTRAAALKAIGAIRRDGLAVVRHNDLVGIAVPVLSEKHKILAALGLYLPESRDDAHRRPGMIACLRRHAQRLQEQIESM